MQAVVEEAVPPVMMSPRSAAGGADVLRMVIELLEQERPQVDEALRVARGGLKLLELSSTAAGSDATVPAPISYAGPPHDRKLLVRVGRCCEVESSETRASHVVVKLAGSELRTLQAKDAEPRFDSQIFQFPLHSLAAERGSSETLSVELYQKKKIGFELVGTVALDFGRVCSSEKREPPFQPLLGCAETLPAQWVADADQLPGQLRCVGVVEVPPPEFTESCRDFTRAFAATASGSGDMLLLGPREIQDHNTMKPIKSEIRCSGDVNQEVSTAAVSEFEGIIRASVNAAGIDLTDDRVAVLCRRLIGHLTVTPAMQLLLDFDVSPALYQNKFVVLTGKGGVRVATYGYIGDSPEGDRPDRKHTGVVLRMLTGDLVSSCRVDDSGSESNDSVTFSCKLTTAELMDDVVAEDLPLLIEAVTSGCFDAFSAAEPLPQEWFQDTYHRLESETSDGTRSTGALQLTVAIMADDNVPAAPLELTEEDEFEAAEAQLLSLAAAEEASDQTDLTQRRDHNNYAVPAMIGLREWKLQTARALRAEEIAIEKWYEYMAHTPRICPLEIRTDWDTATGKEVSKPVVSPELHKLISSGIPSEWACGEHESMTMSCMEMGAEFLAMVRPKLWLELTGAKDLKLSSKIDYHKMSGCTNGSVVVEDWLELTGAASAYEAMEKSRKQIEKDLPRTGVLTEDETEQLRRVLLTFVLKWPSIGYCQSMNFIALGCLRVTHSEENAFWLLGAIAQIVLPNYYTASMTGTQVDMSVLGQLVEMKLPVIHEHLQSLEVPLQILVSQWLLPVFITTFSPSVTFAVWDWLFIDGPDVLLLVALAFISLHQTDILGCSDFGAVVTLFAELPHLFFHPSSLLRRARSFQIEIGGKLARLRGDTTSSVTSSGEEQNKERLVRQMVKETHLTEEDINQLHQRFMTLESKTRKQPGHSQAEVTPPGTTTQDATKGSDKKAKRQRRGSVASRRRRGSVLQSFKKSDAAEQAETVYEERGIGFDGFAELLSEELPQWAGTGDQVKLRGLFHAFDTDSSGKISVAQFIQGIATFTGGDVDKRLQMIFRTVDADQSGLVSHDEMLKLFIDSYNMFYPGMSTAGIPQLVSSIFQRLEVEPSHGLNFDEFCVTVKSQPLLLECFSQQALDARAREDEASAERAIALHGLENFESKMMAVIPEGKKAKWKEYYFVLQEGVLSVFADKKSHDKGKRLQRVDLKSGDVRVELQRDGGGKSGLEESLLLQWPEGQHGELRELRMSEPQSYTYDWSRGLKDATTLYRWDQLLTLFTASHDRSQTSAMAEIHTLCAMPPTVLEQLIRALVLDMRSTDPSGGTPTTRNVAGEAATLALTEGLPTVSRERHEAIKNCCRQVLTTGGEGQNILAMVRRGVAIEQLEEQLAPYGLLPEQSRIFYDVLSETARMERAAAFQEHEDGYVVANGEGLASVPIFSACAAHVRHDVASSFSSCHHDGGTYIFRQGDRGDSMYCIVRGDVQVVKEPEADGEADKVLAVLSAGHCFGEMSLLSSEVRSASMRCLGDTLVMRLDLDAFTRLTTMYPELRVEMTKVAAERAAFGGSKETRKKLSTRRVPNGNAEASPSGPATAPRITVARDQRSTSLPRPAAATMSQEEASAVVEHAHGLAKELEEAVELQNFDDTRRLTAELEALSPQRKIAAAVVEKAV